MMQRTYDSARQHLQQTPLDRTTRRTGSFPDAERSLPLIHPPTSMLTSLLSPSTLFQNVASYLGHSNPFAHSLDPSKESCWLFDSTAYRPRHAAYNHAKQPFQAEMTVAYFRKGEDGKGEKETGEALSRVITGVAKELGLGDLGGDLGEEWGDSGFTKGEVERRIGERLRAFVDEIVVGRWVDVYVGGTGGEGGNMEGGKVKGKRRRLGPGGRSGVSQDTVVVGGPQGKEGVKDGDVLETRCVDEKALGYGPGKCFVTDEEGWMVISDIDDTIKITMTPSPIGILRSTFVSDPTPIPGMPEFYTHIQKQLPSPVVWSYLSASPYNLYPFLHTFINTHYPPGTIFLREASWMDLGGFLASLTQGTEAYKVSRLVKIHEWLPRRKTICIGDSTQSDPESYGDVYRKFAKAGGGEGAGWVKRIFIRKVDDVAEMKGSGKNDDERFEKAFEGVPAKVWKVFEKPEELWEEIEGLAKGEE